MEQASSQMRKFLGVIAVGMAVVFCIVACRGGAGTEQEGADAQQEDQNESEDQPTQNQLPDPDNQNNQPREPQQPDADKVDLAVDGEAELTIVIGEDADPSQSMAAEELAEYLEQISGAEFAIETGDGSEGLVVGVPEDFEELPMDDVAFGDGSFDREDYILRTKEDRGLYVLGSTPLAVRFGVWDLLYRIGHRQFFPTDTWEVIPEKEEVTVAVDVYERPDYYNRKGPRGAMRMDLRDWAHPGWENWRLRNRATPTFDLATGHAYDSVISSNQSAFDSNPEYWGLVDGQRTSDAQPNVANEDVQQMFIDHALGRFAADPSRDSVAMDPRDGNFWSESDESLAIGGPSEQAVYLANLVAEEVVEEYGEDKYVGIYGYSHHSPPPEIEVHDNVIVSLATDYIRGGYTFEEMIDGWSQKANMLGIREYYGLWIWHNSLPGHGARAGNTELLAETIPHWHDRGARFMNAESNDTWGGYGLGYYLATRLMWDVSEADRVDEIIEDFVQKAFGPAEEPMAEFYELIDGSSADPYNPEVPRPMNDDMVGRMYRLLDDARDLAEGDDAVVARIDDLILYTHYVELYRRFDEIEGPERQEAFDDMVSFAWRMRDTMMAESIELVRAINREVNSDDNVQWGPGRTSNQPSDHHRVDEDVPFSDSEIETMLQEGIDNHELIDLDMEPWEDSGQLEPAYLPADERGELPQRGSRSEVDAVIYTSDGTLPSLTMSTGIIYDDRGPTRWRIKDEDGDVVADGEVEPNEEDHHFDPDPVDPGLYSMRIDNTSQGFIWDYEPRGAKLTILAGGEHRLGNNWYELVYYYVPEGTEDIYLSGTLLEGRHDFVDGDGNTIDPDDIEEIQGYTRVPVPEGQDGEIWSLELVSLRPQIRFLNVPGYVALSPDELVLPEEVVDELE